MAANQRYLRTWGITNLVGQGVKGIVAPFHITYTGLMAGAHKEGAAAVRRYINFLKSHGWDSSSVISDFSTRVAAIRGSKSISEADKQQMVGDIQESERQFRAIETRIREFEGRNYFKDPEKDPIMLRDKQP